MFLSLFLKFKFIYFNWRLVYNIVLVLPYINMNLPRVYMCSQSWTPPPTSLPIPFLWVIPVHQPQASCIMHRTWTGDLFLIWYYTCFNAILPNHPTLSLSHRVQKTLLWVKKSACQCRRHKRFWFDPWIGKIPWSRKWLPTPVFLPGIFHGQRSLASYNPWDRKEVDTTECTRTHPHPHTGELL